VSDGYRTRRTFRVEGGLHMIRGNHAPYFSLTYWAHRKGHPNQSWSGGAGHDVILSLWPDLADLAALHLSDIDGVPMHAEANGWYQLAGAMGGMGQRYHAGNSEPIRTETECLQAFARHCRIDMNEAYAIRSAVQRAYAAALNPDGDLLTTVEARAVAPTAARAEWGRIMEAMRPRWKREAEECIARHGLIVYGDPWTRPEHASPLGPPCAQPCKACEEATA
jgi:hypothetical protein